MFQERTIEKFPLRVKEKNSHNICGFWQDCGSEALLQKSHVFNNLPAKIQSEREHPPSDDECQSVDKGNEQEDLFQTDRWDIKTYERDNVFKPKFRVYKTKIPSKNERDAYDGDTDTYEPFE